MGEQHSASSCPWAALLTLQAFPSLHSSVLCPLAPGTMESLLWVFDPCPLTCLP